MVGIRIERYHNQFDGRAPSWVDFVTVVTPLLASSSLDNLSASLDERSSPLEVSEAIKESIYSPNHWLEGGAAYEDLMNFAIRRKGSADRSPLVIPHPFWGAKAFVHQPDGYHIVISPLDTGVFLEQRSKRLQGMEFENILSQAVEPSPKERLGSGSLISWDIDPFPIYVQANCPQEDFGYARDIMRLASCARSRLGEGGYLNVHIAKEEDGDCTAALTSRHGCHRFPNSGKCTTPKEWAKAFRSMATSLNKSGVLKKDRNWMHRWVQWWVKPFCSCLAIKFDLLK